MGGGGTHKTFKYIPSFQINKNLSIVLKGEIRHYDHHKSPIHNLTAYFLLTY